MEPSKAVTFSVLSETLRTYRKARNLSLREASKESKISVSTLSRIERAEARPDTDTIRALVDWMRVPLERVLLPLDTPRHGAPHPTRQMAQTLAQVEVHLRADPNLDADTAHALAVILRTAYKRFVVPK